MPRSPAVATCRQTVEALLAPHHRLAADGHDSAADDSPSPDVATCRPTVEALLAPHHRLAADGYDLAAEDSPSPDVATCRQANNRGQSPRLYYLRWAKKRGRRASVSCWLSLPQDNKPLGSEDAIDCRKRRSTRLRHCRTLAGVISNNFATSSVES